MPFSLHFRWKLSHMCIDIVSCQLCTNILRLSVACSLHTGTYRKTLRTILCCIYHTTTRPTWKGELTLSTPVFSARAFLLVVGTPNYNFTSQCTVGVTVLATANTSTIASCNSDRVIVLATRLSPAMMPTGSHAVKFHRVLSLNSKLPLAMILHM